jgi:energy-coupling factor transporter ATP-binding protein EcfA2
MCAVVGPNGCGKSNIIDAVRWVMGESSAKNLRGESMADVIFNGSGGSPARWPGVHRAGLRQQRRRYRRRVRELQRDLHAPQVTRDGQSEYFLNGTKCRRRDITDIFLGTGLGPRSYAIIEQGMISRLIESKPEELRVFIEEAAGISKYKERRRETESRMRRTLENLERLTDLRDELGASCSTCSARRRPRSATRSSSARSAGCASACLPPSGAICVIARRGGDGGRRSRSASRGGVRRAAGRGHAHRGAPRHAQRAHGRARRRAGELLCRRGRGQSHRAGDPLPG